MTAVAPRIAIDNVTRARAAWGDAPPDWVTVLAVRCNELGSQRKVADALGYSPAVINQVLANTYKAGLNGIADKVRGRFMSETLPCPFLGELSIADCLDYQARPYASTNARRVQIYRACRGCQHNRSNQR